MTTTEARARLIALEHEHADLRRRLDAATAELQRLRSAAPTSEVEALAHAHAARNYAPEVYDDVE